MPGNPSLVVALAQFATVCARPRGVNFSDQAAESPITDKTEFAMKHLPSSGSVPALLLAFGLIATMTGCAATPSTADGLTAGRETTVQGEVASIDRSPMAYDGDGLLVLSTRAHGAVTVHVPARSNLCKAQGLALFNTVTVGARMRATGTATGPADISVCVEPTHGLKLEE